MTKRNKVLRVHMFTNRTFEFYMTEDGYYRYDIDKEYYVALKKVSEDPEQWKAVRAQNNSYFFARESKPEPTPEKAVWAITSGFAVGIGTL